MSDTEGNSSSKMTAMQRRFADYWVEAKANDIDVTNAEMAKAAGYQGNEETLKVAASKCLSSPAVKAYLQELAKQHLTETGWDAVVAIRKVTRDGSSRRVQGDVALRLAQGIGLLQGEARHTGPAVVLNLVLPAHLGALLAQSPARGGQAHVIEGECEQGHSLPEGDGYHEAPEGGGTGGSSGRRPEGGRTKKTPASVSPTAVGHDFPPATFEGGRDGG